MNIECSLRVVRLMQADKCAIISLYPAHRPGLKVPAISDYRDYCDYHLT